METVTVDFSPIYEFKYCQIPNHGFHFLLLDENNRALHSPFECKDYINDILYSEYTNRPAGIWGISWKPGMMNVNRDRFRLCLMGGGEKMDVRAEAIEEFLKFFEDAQGFQPTRVYLTENPENIVVEFSKEWTSSGPLISAYNTLLRLSGDYKIGERAIPYLKRLIKNVNSTIKPDYMAKDVKKLPKYLEKLAALLEGKKFELPWDSFQNINYVHDTGIIGYADFPVSSLDGVSGNLPEVDEDDEE